MLVGVGDVNGDGHVDLVWRNYSTGQNTLWLMNRTSFTRTGTLASVADPNWNIESVADFNRDGHADLAWGNYSSGANSIWFMNRAAIHSFGTVDSVPNLNWHIGPGPESAEDHQSIFFTGDSSGRSSETLHTDRKPIESERYNSVES